MTAHLARDRSSVRLRPIIKEGGTRDTVTAIDKGEADLAIVRRDIGMPKDGLTVAIWRKNVAVFIVPSQPEPAAAKTRAARRAAAAAPKLPKIEKVENLVGRRLGVIGRSPSNIILLKAILLQYRHTAGQGRRPGRRRRSEAERTGQGHRRSIRPEQRRRRDPRSQDQGRRHFVGRPGQQFDHRRCDRRRDARQGAAVLPRDRRVGGHRRAQPSLRVDRDQGRRVRRLAAATRGNRRNHRGQSLSRRAARS